VKDYPSIDGSDKAPVGQHCVAFRKYDGSNLRAAWHKKRGWHKWGTRTHLFDRTDPDFGPAIQLFEEKYAEPLARAIVDFKDFKKPEEVIAFMEFLGPQSFAGLHHPESLRGLGIETTDNEPKDVVLFDVNIYKRGIIGPRNFLKAFGHLPVAEVVYEGVLTKEFIQDVRDGKIVAGEGVICKSGDGHQLRMCKIKTLQYLRLLQERFGTGNWNKYGE
jgi:hypothetical protein